MLSTSRKAHVLSAAGSTVGAEVLIDRGGLPSTSPNRVDLTGALVSWRALVAAALLSLALGLGLFEGFVAKQSSLPLAAHRHLAAAHTGLSSLPLTAQGVVSATLGADSPAYRISASGAGLQAQNPAQRMRLRFDRSGVQISSGGTLAGLRLRAVGYGASLQAVGGVAPTVKADRVTYVRPGLTEWYRNGPLGLEQGFTLAHAPTGHRTGPLTLSMALSGDARARLASAGDSVVLGHSIGSSLRYGELAVTDARGRTLHSWLELRSGALLLKVDTHGAHYPLRIDPFIQQGSPLKGEGANDERFGGSVALSADGNTALIGAVGEAFVFVRSGSEWMQQGESLHPGNAGAGQSVALSADGDTAIVAAPSSGVVWFYARTGSTWTEQGSISGGGGGSAGFGQSVALSANGETALIGVPGYFGGIGAALVYTRSGSTWQETPTAVLTGSGETGEAQLGHSVALSAEGNTAIVGGPLDNFRAGAVWVFTRSGSTWSQQGEKLTGAGESGQGYLGESVALSSDGNTALIGGYANNEYFGAAWVFARSGSTWAQQGEKLTGTGESGHAGFASGVALSADGNTAAIGGSGDNANVGAVWTFDRSGSTWAQQGEKLIASGETGSGEFGASLALSSDGDTALIGGPYDNSAKGAAWVFTNLEPPTVTGVTPTAGLDAGGTTVQITGTEFTGTTGVNFGSTAATSFTVNSPTSISATAPAGTGTVDVTVTNPGGTSATGPSDHFTYVPIGSGPTIKKVAPAKGPAAGGTSVAITGTAFTGVTEVEFGSTEAASFTVNSATSITAISPAGTAGTVDVIVATPNGTSAISSKDHFKYEAPTVTGVSPNTGSKTGGTSVTVTGSGFALGTTATTFKFGTVLAMSVDCISTTSCTVVAPAHKAGTVDLKATVATSSSKANPPADQFTYS